MGLDKIKKKIPHETAERAKKVFFKEHRKKHQAKKKINKNVSPGEYFTDLIDPGFHYIQGPEFLFLYEEIFEREIYHFETNSDQPYILDAGANIGMSSVYLNLLYPNAEIHAFEPNPNNLKALKKNVSLFGLEKSIHIHESAIWTEDGKLTFDSGNSTSGRIKENSGTVVQAERLSKYIDREVDLLKIDIEGAEYDVLHEIKDKLPLVKNIFVECHSFVDQPIRYMEALQIISDAGYELIIHGAISQIRPFSKDFNLKGMRNMFNLYGKRKAD